jgi:VWFA-related protein
MMRRPSLALLLIFSSFVTGLGQTPVRQTTEPQQDQDEVVRITANLVQIDAVVTDKKGEVVTDLTADDFEVYEDGRPQKVTNLSFIPTAGPAQPAQPAKPGAPSTAVDRTAPPVPTAPLRPEQVRRTMALIVDDLGLSFESTYFVRRALKKFVDEQMQPGDLIAIIRTSGGIGVLQQFTSDKRQLYAAIERVRWSGLSRGGVNAVAPIEGNIVESAQPGDEEFHEEANKKPGELDKFRSDLFAIGTLGAINYVVRGLKGLPGRKSVLLISDGLNINTENRERILAALRGLTDLANRSSVVIYTMDARGLQTLGLTAADNVSSLSASKLEEKMSDRRSEFFDTQSGLIYLAKQTGGFAVRNNNDLSGGIRRVLQDQTGYYLIGYRPEESTFDPQTGQRHFNKLDVRVKRKGLQVRTRAGFYGVTDEANAAASRTREQRLATALVSPFNANAIDLRLTSLFGNDPKLGSFMRSLLYIDARDLTFTEEADGWHKAVLDVAALTFGDNGQLIDSLNRTQTIRIRGNTFQNVLKNGLVFYLNVPVKRAGAYQLRVAVRDPANEKIGSASQFIEVPDLAKKRLTLSGLVVNGYKPRAAPAISSANASPDNASSTGAAQTVNGAEGTREEEEPDPEASAAVRQFRHGMVMNYGYIIYNAQVDKGTARPQLQTQLRLFRDGKLIFSGKLQSLNTSNQQDPARITANGALQLGTDMIPGEYVLQVVVTDLLVKDIKRRTATQWIDFEIVK